MVYKRQYCHRHLKNSQQQQQQMLGYYSSLSCAVSSDFGPDLFFLLNVTNFFTPITIGAMPSRPMIYAGITNEIDEPRALIDTSKPIPIYCPTITCRTGKVGEENNIMRTKKYRQY